MEASILSLVRQSHPWLRGSFCFAGFLGFRWPLWSSRRSMENAGRDLPFLPVQRLHARRRITTCSPACRTVEGRADVLVFADAGHLFPVGWLERLVAPIAGGDRGGNKRLSRSQADEAGDLYPGSTLSAWR